MLTRLRIRGFKNLLDVDIPFGPFTCVAGANGVGKSNLFDAITFLSALADGRQVLEAACSVRSDDRHAGDVQSLFRRVGPHSADEIRFEVEMLIPKIGVDDLGQEARATITFLEYSLVLAQRRQEGDRDAGLEIREERLVHVKLEEAGRRLGFKHSPAWRKSVVTGRRGSPFISTDKAADGSPVIKLHGDGGKSGRSRQYPAKNLPRTVLSAANAAEAPTALLARREMQSWRLLQLEPSAMRAPDPFNAPARLAATGTHLPATLARLARVHSRVAAVKGDASRVYTRVANRLSGLVEGIRTVRVDADERRELLALKVTNRDGTEHDARSLSDGTLRFLALAVLASDPEALGLLCLEEPENGIHPERTPEMLALLRELVVDASVPVGPDNPLRQVIVNSHSPAVVAQVHDDSLVYAAIEPTAEGARRASAPAFRWLKGNWREKLLPKHRSLARGELQPYINPLGFGTGTSSEYGRRSPRSPDGVPVARRPDMQLLLPIELPSTVHE
jgi:predicted ATPase